MIDVESVLTTDKDGNGISNPSRHYDNCQAESTGAMDGSADSYSV